MAWFPPPGGNTVLVCCTGGAAVSVGLLPVESGGLVWHAVSTTCDNEIECNVFLLLIYKTMHFVQSLNVIAQTQYRT